jgi:kynurenine 3-monooxygenase
MPWSIFETLKTQEDVMVFFEEEFPDALKMIGKEKLLKDFFDNPLGSLVSVKCQPYHYKHRALIVGDAAHAMVPFYGQGMNCGFEDILVLDCILEKHLLGARASAKVMQSVLAEYTATRHADAVAICDLAMYNYTEMRSGVTTLKYKARKCIESALHFLFPSLVIPLYTMVSFTRIPYSEAYQRWKTQSKLLEWSAISLGTVAVGMTSLYLLRRLGIRSISFLLDQGKIMVN